jgi:putative ABC transport system permease protein
LSITLGGADPRIMAGEINNISGVQRVGAASGNLGVNASGNIPVKTGPGTQAVGVDYFDVDSGFIHVMDLKILAGRTFVSKKDAQHEEYVIMNESAIKSLSFQTPEEAVGQTVWLQDSVAVQVCGVVKDFYYQGLEQLVTPLMLRNRSDHFNLLTVKTAGDQPSILGGIKEVWKKHQPGNGFDGQWLEDILYKKRSAWSTVSMLGFLSFMAITIACLGLLGMVIYTTETRRKEIGIRKVMGASVSAIIALLSRGFIKLIIISGLIALPVSYLLGYIFLSFFANRINLGIGSLMICFLGLLFMVLIVIGSQIYKVAIANPVHSLRTE